VLLSCLVTFLVDVACQEYVKQKYGFETATSVEEAIVAVTAEDAAVKSMNALQAAAQEACCDCECANDAAADVQKQKQLEGLNSTAFRQQFMAFFILEAGIILHSVFIGTFSASSILTRLTESRDRPQLWRCRRGMESPLRCTHLPSVFRRSRHWRTHVGDSVPGGP